jgi:hypothetical protein
MIFLIKNNNICLAYMCMYVNRGKTYNTKNLNPNKTYNKIYKIKGQ